jgi:hypothetical protein
LTDPDASRSFVERDSDVTGRHELPGLGSSFGSAGRPRADFGAEHRWHSHYCSRFGRDRNGDRRALGRGSGRTERSGRPLHLRVHMRTREPCRPNIRPHPSISANVCCPIFAMPAGNYPRPNTRQHARRDKRALRPSFAIGGPAVLAGGRTADQRSPTLRGRAWQRGRALRG